MTAIFCCSNVVFAEEMASCVEMGQYGEIVGRKREALGKLVGSIG